MSTLCILTTSYKLRYLLGYFIRRRFMEATELRTLNKAREITDWHRFLKKLRHINWHSHCHAHGTLSRRRWLWQTEKVSILRKLLCNRRTKTQHRVMPRHTACICKLYSGIFWRRARPKPSSNKIIMLKLANCEEPWRTMKNHEVMALKFWSSIATFHLSMFFDKIIG